jgi:hypothetical protein
MGMGEGKGGYILWVVKQRECRLVPMPREGNMRSGCKWISDFVLNVLLDLPIQ